jgi:elongation factor G
MTQKDVKKTRNIGIVGHGGAGKTSLVEHWLFETGAMTRLGRIEDKNTVSDFLDEERERGNSISLSLVHVKHRDHLIQIIDTPGYADFIGEVVAAVPVVDSLVVVVDGVDGLQVGTDNCWQYADDHSVPRLVFVNKLDKDTSDFYRVLTQLEQSYGTKCAPIGLPAGSAASFEGVINLMATSDESAVPETAKGQFSKYREKLIDAIAEADDALLEKYLEGEALSQEEMARGLLAGIKTCSIVPVFCGSVEKNVGINELLDIIVDCMPSPADCLPRKATKGADEEVEIHADPNGPLCGLAFKTLTAFVGNLTCVRIFSGTLKADSEFFNASKGVKERLGNILQMQGKEQATVEAAGPGDTVAIPKLKSTVAGDAVCGMQQKLKLPGIVFPEPWTRIAIEPKSRADEDKIGQALRKLTDEDPTFLSYRDEATRDHIIAGMGDLHLDVQISRLKNKYKVDIETKLPKVAYKETIKGKTEVQGRYKRQSGGRGQYGDCWIKVEPLPHDEGFEFVDKIVGGAIPRNYIPAVEKGIVEALQKGIIAGYPVVDIKVTLYDGTYHTVDSSDMAFHIAGSMAIQKAVLGVKHCLLEPVMELEVVVPDDAMGDITGDLNGRRGRIVGMEPRAGKQVIKAQVPFAEVLRYSTDLRSMTGGRGSFSMKLSHYDEVPERLAQEIIAHAQKEKEES